jgi:hypothetical protein
MLLVSEFEAVIESGKLSEAISLLLQMWTAILSREDVVVVSKAIYDFLAFMAVRMA